MKAQKKKEKENQVNNLFLGEVFGEAPANHLDLFEKKMMKKLSKSTKQSVIKSALKENIKQRMGTNLLQGVKNN